MALTKKQEIGAEGEENACKFLEKKKYKILERNWKRKQGEIDIVGFDRDGVLVFVEVKTVHFWKGGLSPEDQMTRGKIIRFKRAVQMYVGSHEDLVNDKKGFRCDLLALTKIENDFVIKHYENI